MLGVLFVRKGLIPSRHSRRAVKHAPRVCYLILVCEAALVLCGVSVWLGFWGSWTPGQQCVMVGGDMECTHVSGVCDEVDPSECLLPFPSSVFLRNDASSLTGLRPSPAHARIPDPETREHETLNPRP